MIRLPGESLERFRGDLESYVEGYLGLDKVEAYPVLERRLAPRLTEAFDAGISRIAPGAVSLEQFVVGIDAQRRSRYRGSPQLLLVDAVSEYVKEQFDYTLLWFAAACALWEGDFAVGASPYLEELVKHDRGDLPWLVAASSWVEYWSGQGAHPMLANSLRRLVGSVAGLEADLAKLAASSDPFLCEAGRRGLAALASAKRKT